MILGDVSGDRNGVNSINGWPDTTGSKVFYTHRKVATLCDITMVRSWSNYIEAEVIYIDLMIEHSY
jgi:hypothetical protein